MKAVVHYTQELRVSRQWTKRLVESLEDQGWDYELREGYTPSDCPFVKVSPYSYMSSFKEPRLQTKKACFANHLRLWREAVYDNETKVFLEHDVVCVGKMPEITSDVMHLSYDTAKYSHDERGMKFLTTYNRPMFKGAKVMAGTSAYSVTPEGAETLISTYERLGADQSDCFVNSHVVNIGCPSPSPFALMINTFNSSSGRYWND